jgi:hypothetical protein
MHPRKGVDARAASNRSWWRSPGGGGDQASRLSRLAAAGLNMEVAMASGRAGRTQAAGALYVAGIAACSDDCAPPGYCHG